MELACKDALSSKRFKNIDEMLLRLYYLYEKSPKKCRELEDVVSELKEVYEFPKTGNMPVCAQGSRWINHKRNALQHVVDRYGAYLNHLSAVAEDCTTKSEDKAHIKGYIKKWQHSRMIIGAALYIDVLKPA